MTVRDNVCVCVCVGGWVFPYTPFFLPGRVGVCVRMSLVSGSLRVLSVCVLVCVACAAFTVVRQSVNLFLVFTFSLLNLCVHTASKHWL